MGQSKMSFPRQVNVLIHVNTWQFTNEMNMWDYKLLAGACLTEVISNRGMAGFFFSISVPVFVFKWTSLTVKEKIEFLFCFK